MNSEHILLYYLFQVIIYTLCMYNIITGLNIIWLLINGLIHMVLSLLWGNLGFCLSYERMYEIPKLEVNLNHQDQ